jgi:C4-type Zn-finger protein
MEDETYTAIIETMYGPCPQCNRDYSMTLMGVFVNDNDNDNDELIETFVECSDCGYRID